MPYLSDEEYKTLIVGQVNDAGGTVVDMIDTLWNLHLSQPQPYLRYLYTWRSAIDWLMGEERRRVSYQSSGDLSVTQSQLMTNLETMMRSVRERIVEAVKSRSALRGGAHGLLRTTAPINPPITGGIDANDRQYRGDPYYRSKRRRES